MTAIEARDIIGVLKAELDALRHFTKTLCDVVIADTEELDSNEVYDAAKQRGILTTHQDGTGEYYIDYSPQFAHLWGLNDTEEDG
jgi:hypothetical protein